MAGDLALLAAVLTEACSCLSAVPPTGCGRAPGQQRLMGRDVSHWQIKSGDESGEEANTFNLSGKVMFY